MWAIKHYLSVYKSRIDISYQYTTASHKTARYFCEKKLFTMLLNGCTGFVFILAR